jgi:hypothetical protein
MLAIAPARHPKRVITYGRDRWVSSRAWPFHNISDAVFKCGGQCILPRTQLECAAPERSYITSGSTIKVVRVAGTMLVSSSAHW